MLNFGCMTNFTFYRKTVVICRYIIAYSMNVYLILSSYTQGKYKSHWVFPACENTVKQFYWSDTTFVWPQVDDISIHVNTKINLSIKRHFRSLNSCRKSSSSNHNEKDTHTNMEVQEWIPRSNIYFTVNIWVEILWTP